MAGASNPYRLVFPGEQAYIIAAQGRSAQALQRTADEVTNAFNSYRALNDSKRELEALTLRVVTAAKVAGFAALGSSSPLGKKALLHLRALSTACIQLGEPATGQPLKVVE